MSGKDIWTTDEGRQMCRHGGLSHSLNTSCPDEGERLICDHCGKDVDTHPTVDVSHTDRMALCQERAIKWQRVEPGYVIPAGQPYRIEWHDDDLRYGTDYKPNDHDFTIRESRAKAWFIDSSWKPPLVLPTEPTWGIAVKRDGSRWMSRWRVLGTELVTMSGDAYAWPAKSVLDFIELTPEQVQRIEAAR